jgi:tetratricopeptide (TPR) repeat protein
MIKMDNDNLIKSIFSFFNNKKKINLLTVNNRYILDLILQTTTVENTINPRGLVLFQANQFEAALEIFTQNIKVDEEHIDSIYHKGLCLFNLGKYMEALETMQVLNDEYEGVAYYNEESRNKLNDDYYSLNCEISKLEGDKKYLEAITLCNKMLLIIPESYSYNTKGNLLYKLGKYNEAIEQYDKSIGFSPIEHDVYEFKANALYNLGKVNEAIECFDESVKQVPERSRYLAKGNYLYKLALYDQVLESFDKVIELFPDYPEALNNKGYVLNQIGRYEESVICYNKAIELKPSYQLAILNKAKALESLKRSEEAAACYTKVLEIDPENTEAREGLNNFLTK